ncbi:hypothetical protein Tco_0710952 [Tanacetum coccineum]
MRRCHSTNGLVDNAFEGQVAATGGGMFLGILDRTDGIKRCPEKTKLSPTSPSPRTMHDSPVVEMPTITRNNVANTKPLLAGLRIAARMGVPALIDSPFDQLPEVDNKEDALSRFASTSFAQLFKAWPRSPHEQKEPALNAATRTEIRTSSDYVLREGFMLGFIAVCNKGPRSCGGKSITVMGTPGLPICTAYSCAMIKKFAAGGFEIPYRALDFFTKMVEARKAVATIKGNQVNDLLALHCVQFWFYLESSFQGQWETSLWITDQKMVSEIKHYTGLRRLNIQRQWFAVEAPSNRSLGDGIIARLDYDTKGRVGRGVVHLSCGHMLNNKS